MSFFENVRDLRLAMDAKAKKDIQQRSANGSVRKGFIQETLELNRALKANVKNGRGNRSLIEAVQMQAVQIDEPKKKPNHARTFFISALFGALWQSTRRR